MFRYLERKARKLVLYSQHGLNLISVDEKDMTRLDDILPEKLRAFLPRGFKFE